MILGHLSGVFVTLEFVYSIVCIYVVRTPTGAVLTLEFCCGVLTLEFSGRTYVWGTSVRRTSVRGPGVLRSTVNAKEP